MGLSPEYVEPVHIKKKKPVHIPPFSSFSLPERALPDPNPPSFLSVSLFLSFLLRRCRGANSDPGTAGQHAGSSPAGCTRAVVAKLCAWKSAWWEWGVAGG